MGGVRHLMPMTHLLMVIGTIAITGVGLPFVTLFGAPLGTAGFVSKDVVIESAFAAATAGAPFAMYAFVMGLIAAMFTAFYSWRLIFLTFWGKSRAAPEVSKDFHAPPNWMMWPLVPLAIGALVVGMVFYSSFVGSKADSFWNGALYSAQSTTYADAGADVGLDHGTDSAEADHGTQGGGEAGGGHHDLPAWVIVSPFIAMVLGTLAAAFHYLRGSDPLRPGLLREGGMIYAFLRNKWYFDEIYDFLLVRPAYWLGRLLWKVGDGRIIDGFGPNGIAALVVSSARRIVRIQTGYMYHYAFVMLIGVAVLISFVLFNQGGN